MIATCIRINAILGASVAVGIGEGLGICPFVRPLWLDPIKDVV